MFPVVPVGPVVPVDPVAPVLPVCPVFPVDPVLPDVPVLPVEPVLPVDPVDPVGPVDPVFPVGPVFPVDPVLPVVPVLPVDPVDPQPVSRGFSKSLGASGKMERPSYSLNRFYDKKDHSFFKNSKLFSINCCFISSIPCSFTNFSIITAVSGKIKSFAL